MKVRLLDTKGEISKEVFVLNDKDLDHKQNPLLEGKRRNVRAHPSRVLPLTDGAAMVFRGLIADKPVLLAKCPQCQIEIRVDIKNCQETECPDHGGFKLSWLEITPGRIPISDDIINGKPKKQMKKKSSKPRASIATKISVDIDFALARKIGEVWTKHGQFDYTDFVLRSHVIIIHGDPIKKEPPRKFCFNSYNLTWGKKSKQHELEAFLANKPLDGVYVGRPITGTLDHMRKKMQKEGYQRDE